MSILHNLRHLLLLAPSEMVSATKGQTVWLATRCVVCGRISGKFASSPIPFDDEFRP